MKALSVKQPWASLICCGLKDVENRKWALRSLPMRVLIHAGAKPMPITEENQFDWMCGPSVWNIENYKLMGILPDFYQDFPTGAVVGVATIVACEKYNDSIWAERGPGAEYQWVLRDVKMFKNPIYGVKGALGIFDIPGIDEYNLPEFVDIPQIQRRGTSIRIPLCLDVFEQIIRGNGNILRLYLTDLNVHLFADCETLEPLPTDSVTFFCNGEEITKPLREYDTYFEKDEKGNVIEDEDILGRVYSEAKVKFVF